MTCADCQKKIIDSLATGLAVLPPEALEHQQSCAACERFYEAQVSLFRSIDVGLRAYADQPVPPSLLPRIRARLELEPLPRRAGVSSWSLAAVGATAVLVVAINLVWRKPLNTSGALERRPAVSQNLSSSIPPPKSQLLKPKSASPVRPSTSPGSLPTGPLEKESGPEVIVLAEERQAFAEFLTELPREKNLAIALARPAPEGANVPIEIALLQTNDIEVKPLEGTPRD